MMKEISSSLLILYVLLIAVSKAHQICDDIRPPQNGKITIEKPNLLYFVECDPGYNLHGKALVKCIDGKWESLPPKCIKGGKNACRSLVPPANGLKECDEGPIILGTACRFKCLDGYRLNGVRERRCMDDFKWSGLPPKCVSESTSTGKCAVPPELKNGRIIGCSPTKVPTTGSSCHFFCNKGYIRSGPSSLHCQASGKLLDTDGNETFPECVEKIIDTVLGLEGGKVELQCDITPPSTEDEVALVLWYKDESTTPLYSLDSRRRGLYQAKHALGQEIVGRANLDTSTHPTVLKLDRLKAEDEGEYRCRVDFKLARSRNSLVTLEIIKSTQNQSANDDERRSSLHRPSPNNPSHRQPERPRIKPTPKPTYSTWQKGFCENNNGGCEQDCIESKNRTRCSCQVGYELAPDGKRCRDIDECAIPNRNSCQQNCHNTPGGYTCSCNEGYLLNGKKCEACLKDYYWQESDNRCEECPKNSYTVSEASLSIDDCLCQPGFIGNPKSEIGCQDINECDDDNFGCSDKCTNIPGSAYCSCRFGYTVNIDNKTCIDLDECSIKNGGCQGNCHNLDGSFYCSCPEGFRQSNKDQYSCDDINECLQDNGGCAHKCHNHEGGYYCSCENGYRLDSGLHNCTDIGCVIPPLPHFTTMKCKKNKEVIKASDSYTVGTRCTFQCAKGFKITTDSNRIECQADGTWKGPLPECKSQQCPPLPIPENGEVHPVSCATSGNFVKQKCTFTCHPGYNLMTPPIYTCTNKLKWSKSEIPECKQVKIQPTIKCPVDIIVDLLPGQNEHDVIISAPETNVDGLKIEPNWVSVDVPISFPAGATHVTFTASVPKTNRFARCTTIVNVEDKESPVFEFCPPSIRRDNGGPYGVLVEWEEPLVTDNVAIESIESTMNNNSTLPPGTYAVEYTAKDTQGNTATCKFDIIINRMQCNDLSDPVHGRANCMHFRSGKFCQPECDDGYIRHPADPDSFLCGESGNWVPSETISDCLRYISPGPTGCPDGFELEENIETEEFICIANV